MSSSRLRCYITDRGKEKGALLARLELVDATGCDPHGLLRRIVRIRRRQTETSCEAPYETELLANEILDALHVSGGFYLAGQRHRIAVPGRGAEHSTAYPQPTRSGSSKLHPEGRLHGKGNLGRPVGQVISAITLTNDEFPTRERKQQLGREFDEYAADEEAQGGVDA